MPVEPKGKSASLKIGEQGGAKKRTGPQRPGYQGGLRKPAERLGAMYNDFTSGSDYAREFPARHNLGLVDRDESWDAYFRSSMADEMLGRDGPSLLGYGLTREPTALLADQFGSVDRYYGGVGGYDPKASMIERQRSGSPFAERIYNWEPDYQDYAWVQPPYYPSIASMPAPPSMRPNAPSPY